MDWEKLSSQSALLAPLIHVLVCFLYLFGYSTGFGAEIGILFSFSDLFSLSITDVAFIYVSGVVLPIFFLALRSRPRQAIMAKDVSREEYINSIDVNSNNEKKVIRNILLFITIVAILTIPEFVVSIVFDEKFPYIQTSLIVVFLINISFYKISNNLNIGYSMSIFSLLLIACLSNAFFAGMNSGQGDRRYSYEVFYNKSFRCGEYVILRGASGRFIVVDPDGGRAVVDQDCNVVFTVPERPVFSSQSPGKLFLKLFA